MDWREFNQRLRVLLVLGRVSNLPTVWSNCLAAWLLGGGGTGVRFAVLCAGATLLYTGGMFLNDAFDQAFDRQYRPERPIVCGQITAKWVWILGGIWLFLGTLCIGVLGGLSGVLALVLVAAIVLYDAVHKRTTMGPFLMAGCRFLLYLVAGSAAQGIIGRGVWWAAAALGVYIVGLSFLARGESTGANAMRWPTLFLFAPILIGLAGTAKLGPPTLIAAAGQGIWTLWCLWGRPKSKRYFFRNEIAGLLAGIVLVDWLAAAPQIPPEYALVFVGLFLGALFFQRFAPAT